MKPRRAVPMCAVLGPVRWFALGVGLSFVASAPAWGQSAEALRLKPSWSLRDDWVMQGSEPGPVFVSGERISGRPDLETVIEGQAQLRRRGLSVRAERIEFDQPLNHVQASGGVSILREGNLYQGSAALLRLDTNQGYFVEPQFQMLGGGRGRAARVDFLDEYRSVSHQASYSVWHVEPGEPDSSSWTLRGENLLLDNDAELGIIEKGRLEFFGVPILAMPSLSFPVSNQRKSGWLAPTLNFDNLSGIELTVPYYINLAPNRDATVYPSLMSERGVNVGTEFRYLEQNYAGQARLDWIPSDRLRAINRWALVASHSGSHGLLGGAPVGVAVSLNRVSDHDYWRDFPRHATAQHQRLLPSDLRLTWAHNRWSAFARLQKWQTLQQSDSIITPPHARLPQLNLRFDDPDASGLMYSAEFDTTRFVSPNATAARPNAQRSYALLQASLPLQTPGVSLTPKLQLHARNYQFDATSGGSLAGASRSETRVIPTLSVDGGLVFEREARLGGSELIQTLEPRAFLTYTPYRDQASLPVYDSGAQDFNFATIFSESSFAGHDRLSDSQLLTLGLVSRLVTASQGTELMNVHVAQRLRLREERVTLPDGSPQQSGLSDMLFGAHFNWDRDWTSAASVQYNPRIARSQRAVVGLRYSPSDYRVLSAAYRLSRDQSEQIDIGWQWPLNDVWGDRGKQMPAGQGLGRNRLYTVGRVNYSKRDRRPVDTIAGFEYDGGSWLSRLVVERLYTTAQTYTQRIMVQLELVGLARVGSNPLSLLRANVPGYRMLREKMTLPTSPLSNYR